MNPRAWIVTKQGMTGDLYEALAWNNDGKPLGVSITTPTPLYEGEALRAKLTKLDDLLAVIHRDGGHYQAEHGTAKAIEDAIAAVHALRAANGDLRDELEAFQASNDIRGAEVDRLRAENAALLAANRDCLTHFEDMRQEYTGMAHFVADLRAVFSLNECGFTELMNAAIQAQEDAVRYRWMLDHASAEEWREWGKMDAYDDVERAIDEAMRQAAELGNGVGIMK